MSQAVVDEVDHTHTDEVVCPHCGYEFSDSWELNRGREGDWEDECRECGKPILITRYVEIKYSTTIATIVPEDS